MDNINWIELLIKVGIFLLVSYLMFYRWWIKALGQEVAKLSTIEQLTKLEANVKKEFSESLEVYKNKLEEELSLKIEPLKSNLAKNNITHQIQLNILQQERTKIIIELYRKLQELHFAMSVWTAPIHQVISNAEEESRLRTEKVYETLENFRKFYTENKIFFASDFCVTIDDLFQDYWKKAWDFNFKQQRLLSGSLTPEFHKDYSEKLTKISEEIEKQFPKKISEIESQLREMLYVEVEK